MSSPFCAYLRVYEPLVAFDRERQHRWRVNAAGGRVVTIREGPALQRQLVMNALGVGWSRLPELPDEAYLLEDSGALLACPWNLRHRVAYAALSARSGVPTGLADAFIPSTLVTAAEAVRAEWQDTTKPLENQPPRVHESSSGWTIPLRWFVLVDPGEKELVLGPRERWLRYRTSMSRARRRAHRAMAVLRRALGDTPVTMAVEEGARWLEEFHPRSIVELDYGGLAELLSEQALQEDDSPALAAEGLAALSRSDGEAANQAYETLVERWRAVQLLERRN